MTVFNVTAASNAIGTGLMDFKAFLAFKKDQDKHHAIFEKKNNLDDHAKKLVLYVYLWQYQRHFQDLLYLSHIFFYSVSPFHTIFFFFFGLPGTRKNT